MSIGTEIVGRTRKTIQDKLEQIEFFQDQILNFSAAQIKTLFFFLSSLK